MKAFNAVQVVVVVIGLNLQLFVVIWKQLKTENINFTWPDDCPFCGPVFDLAGGGMIPGVAAGNGGAFPSGTGGLQEVEHVRTVFPETWPWASSRTRWQAAALSVFTPLPSTCPPCSYDRPCAPVGSRWGLDQGELERAPSWVISLFSEPRGFWDRFRSLNR